MKAQWKYHKSNPANQPFNVTGRKCQSKTKSWWKK